MSEMSLVEDVAPEQVLRSSHDLGWRGIRAAEVVHPIDDFRSPALDHHLLVFNIGVPMDASEGRSGRSGHLDHGQGVMILPAGRARDWHLERRGEVRHLHVYVEPDFVRGIAADNGFADNALNLEEAFGVHDSRLVHAAMELLRELREPQPGGRLVAESLGMLIGVELLRQHSSASVDAAVSWGSQAGELPAPALRRATEYVEAHLADDLGLSDIAAAAGFSAYHFARLFKATVGVSPHQYVIGRRIKRAESLLKTTDWSVAAIASEVGFATSSHLAHHIRRALGVSPAQLR